MYQNMTLLLNFASTYLEVGICSAVYHGSGFV